MAAGIDTMSNTTSVASQIKNAGYSFVARYYNTNNTSKNLTRAEASALSKAGLSIVAVWENGYPTTASYFSYSKGLSDAQAAISYARNTINQPGGTPIYFAVDYDALDATVKGAVYEYFRGVNTAIINDGLNYWGGVYGSGAVCDYIVNHGENQDLQMITYSWLAQSTGWRGYSSFTGWNLKQGGAVTVAGLSCDTNTSSAAGGGGFKVTY